MGIKKLRKIQLGREATAGTEVAATTIWRGEGTIDDQLELIIPPEDIGYLPDVTRSYIPKYGAGLDLEDTPATFEQLLHLLECGIETVTPSTSGGGNEYTYNFPTTAENTIKTYTVEGGDDQGEEQFLYGFCKNFKISGAAGEALMMSGSLVGRQVEPGTFSGGATLPDVEEILFGKGKFYLDAVSGSFGTTQKTNTFLEFSFEANTGLEEQYTGDGSLTYTFVKNIGPKITMSITYEHDTHGLAAKVDWRAETPRLIELIFEGTDLASPGGTYSYKTLIIQTAGLWHPIAKLGERNGNDIVQGTFNVGYNPTAAEYCNIIVVNDLAAVP